MKSGDGDFTQQQKLEHLIEMVSSTHNQVKDMQKGLSELSANQTAAFAGAVNQEKVIMPRTFILLPFKTEEVPVPAPSDVDVDVKSQVAGDVDVVQSASASSSSAVG